MSGLTARQQWDHDHIARCEGCGTWEIVTDIELRMRAAEQWPAFVGPCTHIEQAFTDAEDNAWKAAS
jgi:hypothetical protein